MRSSASSLLPIFRSDLQGRLLGLLCAAPDAERSISEVSRRLGAHVATVQREVDRLVRAGVLRSRSVGRTRVVSPDPESIVAQELSALALKIYGPPHVLADVLREVPGLEEAYVYGSWADRYEGVPGPPPADIDVLVIGDTDNESLYQATIEAERRLGMPVHTVVQSTERWREASSGFLRTVKEGRVLRLDLQAR